MSDKQLSVNELQSLRNMGNEAEAAADEIESLREKIEKFERITIDFVTRLYNMDVSGDKWITVVGCLSVLANCQIREGMKGVDK